MMFLEDKVCQWHIIKLFSKRNLFIMFLLNAMIIFSKAIQYKSLTFNDLLIYQFYGHGLGYFSLMDFLQMVVYNGVPIYFISNLLETAYNDRIMFLTIRLRKKIRWFYSIITSTSAFILIYVVLTILISLVCSYTLGLSFTGYNDLQFLFEENNLEYIDTWKLLIIITSSKFMELFLMFLLVFLVYIYTKNVTLGFIAIQCAYSVYLLNANFAKFIPIGLSSLSRISEFVGNQGIPYFTEIFLFLVTNILVYFLLRIEVKNKLFS